MVLYNKTKEEIAMEEKLVQLKQTLDNLTDKVDDLGSKIGDLSLKNKKECKWYVFLIKGLVIAGMLWCIISGIYSVCCMADFENRFSVLLVVHIVFFIFFVCSILFSYKIFALKTKIAAEEKVKEDEYKRKKDWETVQYNLNKGERLERLNYERIEKLIDKLDNKEIIGNRDLEIELDDLKKEFNSWKLKKDKQFFIEIKKNIVTNNTTE